MSTAGIAWPCRYPFNVSARHDWPGGCHFASMHGSYPRLTVFNRFKANWAERYWGSRKQGPVSSQSEGLAAQAGLLSAEMLAIQVLLAPPHSRTDTPGSRVRRVWHLECHRWLWHLRVAAGVPLARQPTLNNSATDTARATALSGRLLHRCARRSPALGQRRRL